MTKDRALEIFCINGIEMLKSIDLKKEFRKLVKVYHPDNKETGDAGKFRELKTALAMLEILKIEPVEDMGLQNKWFKFDELKSRKIKVKDINGIEYNYKDVANEINHVVFEAIVIVNNEEFTEMATTRYSMLNKYNLVFNIDVPEQVEISRVGVEIDGVRRVVELSQYIGSIALRISSDNAIMNVELRLNKIRSAEEIVYNICREDEDGKFVM